MLLLSVLVMVGRVMLSRKACISVSDWLEYTFFDLPMVECGYCILDHAGKTVQLSELCEERLPSVECYHDT